MLWLVCAGTKGDVSVLKPTIMNAVPAIVERISKLVRERVASGKHELLRELFDWSYRHKRNKLRQGTVQRVPEAHSYSYSYS